MTQKVRVYRCSLHGLLFILTGQEHWCTLFSQGRSVFCEFISTHLMGGKINAACLI